MSADTCEACSSPVNVPGHRLCQACTDILNSVDAGSSYHDAHREAVRLWKQRASVPQPVVGTMRRGRYARGR